MKTITNDRKLRRKMRVSKKLFGTGSRPRISIYRSSKYIYAQAIDDEKKVTLCASSSKDVKEKMKKHEVAKKVGELLAKKMIEQKIESGVFDRGMYTYLGRVKSLAEGLREGGLKI